MVQNGNDSRSPKLTSRQQQALPIVAAAPSIAEGARLSKIGRSTLNRWLEDAEFRDELIRLRHESSQLAHSELKGLLFEAVDRLAQLMRDSNPTIQLRAVRTILTFNVKIDEVEKMREQVQALEETLPLFDGHWTTK